MIYGEDPLPENGRLDPLRDNFELELVKRALERELSILGICKGCQVLNMPSVEAYIRIYTGRSLLY